MIGFLKRKKKAVIIVIIAIVLITTAVALLNNKKDIVIQQIQNIGETHNNSSDDINFEFQTLKKIDVSDQYNKLKAEYTNIEKLIANPELRQQYKYSLGAIYDLNRDYIGKQFNFDTKIQELDFQGLYSALTSDDIQTYMDKLVNKYTTKKYDSEHKADIGDIITIKIKQVIDNKEVTYVDGGHIVYEIGTDNEWFNGLDNIVLGKKVGYDMQFSIKVPDNAYITDLHTGKQIDAKGKVMDCIAQIVSLDYTDSQISLQDKLIKDYADKIGANFDSIDQFKNVILKNIMWEQVNIFKTSYVLQILKQNPELTKLTESLNTHLNLVAMQIDEEYDKTGPIYQEYVRIATSEFYNSLYEQLPKSYKYDIDTINELKDTICNQTLQYRQSFKSEKDFPNEEQYTDYIKQLQVLLWYVDNNYQNILM